MKIRIQMLALSGVLLSTGIATTALAAAPKPADMSCESFIALDDVVKPKVVYWADGFNKKGKPVDSVVDVEETDRLIPLLVTECKKTPKEKLSKVMQNPALKAKTPAEVKPLANKKPATSARPAKMSCQDFIELDDVIKPKVVYWAEGFNKQGKAADSVVDVAETDRLVPVLVTECKAEPKLTFWQRLKSHF